MTRALIFDMDGVIVDSNPFHKKAWQQFCASHQCDLSDEDMERYIYGKTNHDAIRHVFGEVSAAQEEKYTQQKEALYRDLSKPHLAAVSGLSKFLAEAKSKGVPMAVGTSAPPENVDFVLDGLRLRHYFKVIVDVTMVKNGKPDPEVYLLVAQKLDVNPADCTVFEDSLSGIKAGRAAGMRVIGITTTHSKAELAPLCDEVIDDFNTAPLPA